MTFRAFIDAQILVEARPRDVLLTLAEAGLFAPLWSGLVLEEMLRHLPESMTEEHKTRLVDAMNTAFPDALVEWSGLVQVKVRLSVNRKDRHVVAAALIGQADVVVTEDAQLHGELQSSMIVDAQKLPEFIAYAIDTDQPNARIALIDMAMRTWGASDKKSAEARLKQYFIRRGWDPTGLDASVRPRRPIPWT